MNRGMAMGGSAISKAFGFATNIPGRKVAAAIIWLTSATCTSFFIDQLRTPSYSDSIFQNTSVNLLEGLVSSLWGSSLLAAILFQLVLTVCEKSIWQNRNFTMVSTVAILIDVVVNAAAVWPYVSRFDNTEVWTFLVNWLELNGSAGLGSMATGILCLVVGCVLAAGPEYVWSDR